MSAFASTIKNQSVFLLCFVIYLLVGAYIIQTIPFGELELKVNANHTPFLDLFFKYWTNLGDGWFYTFFAIGVLLWKYYYGILTLIVIGLQTAVVQYLKLSVFDDRLRPLEFFKDNTTIKLVEGVDMVHFNSFPSGHTSTAFAMATLCALIFAKEVVGFRPMIQFLLFVMALFVGFSRIYLFQHFFIDTYFGTIIGTGLSLIIFSVAENSRMAASPLLQRSLIIRKK